MVHERALRTHENLVAGSTVVWVDDHPDWNLSERQILRALGVDVIPVLSNDEALAVVNTRPVALVISDIDHGDEEPGDRLPGRLGALGIDISVVFYVWCGGRGSRPTRRRSVDPGRSRSARSRRSEPSQPAGELRPRARRRCRFPLVPVWSIFQFFLQRTAAAHKYNTGHIKRGEGREPEPPANRPSRTVAKTTRPRWGNG